MSTPRPTVRRRWREAIVKGLPVLGGERPSAGAPQPLLGQAVAWLHAKAVQPRASRQE
jgi:hypothetical protein